MAVKRILGGKSKNLFDISKVVQSAQLKNNGNGTLTVSAYGVSAGILKDLCPNIKVGDTIKAYYTPISWTAQKPPRVMAIGKHVMDRLANPSFVVTEDDLNSKVYFYNNDYSERNLPGTTVIGNIFITNDTTVTAANYKDRYVPYELTSYKSIMKVSDVMQVVDKPVSSTGASLVGTSQTISGITCHYLEDGTGVTLTGTTSNALAIFQFGVYKKPIIGHKYLWFYQHSNASDVINKAHVELKYIDKDGKGRLFSGTEQVYTLSEYAEQFEFHPIVKDNTTCNGFTFKPQLFDLTEMFGPGNEPKTVAEFKAKFPNDYYPYSPSCFVTSFDERMPCKTKNLFSSSTEVGIPSSTGFDKSEKRLLEDGKWYIGLAGSNYYSRDAVLDYSIMENSVYIKWRSNGYSVAKCIYCEPSTTYSFTKKYSLIQGHTLGVNVGFYTEDGTFISFKGETASPHFVFTTPENCKYIAICLSGTKFPNDNFGAGCFSDLQLVKGTTATDYVPYGYV